MQDSHISTICKDVMQLADSVSALSVTAKVEQDTIMGNNRMGPSCFKTRVDCPHIKNIYLQFEGF